MLYWKKRGYETSKEELNQNIYFISGQAEGGAYFTIYIPVASSKKEGEL